MGSKTVKFEEEINEDRISDLPDSIIHHILSFFPSTKRAIQTSVLSKRWRNQWTHVPVLIFDCDPYENFLKFIDNTLILYNRSKINKFFLRYPYAYEKDPQFDAKIRFVTTKRVDDLYLGSISPDQNYMLPEFFFNNVSLVKFSNSNCTFMPNGKVNWKCLTALFMLNCKFSDQSIEHILSGSPLLESLDLCCTYFDFEKLVITSKSLKNLILNSLCRVFYVEISCPMLEKLELFDYPDVRTVKLLNVPSSFGLAIDLDHFGVKWKNNEILKSRLKDILKQLQHVRELEIGGRSIEIISALEEEGLFSQVLNIKCLNLYFHNLNYKCHSGIECILRSSPVLEKLVIDAFLYDRKYDFDDPPEVVDMSGENYWKTNDNVFNCLVSHLKTIQINVFLNNEDKCKLMLNLVQFLLKSAKVLEKMIVVLRDDSDTVLMSKASRELLRMPRCSEYVTIELLRSTYVEE